jgi:hypothetical protein
MKHLEKPFRLTEKDKELLPVHNRPSAERGQEKARLEGEKQIPVRTYYADADKKPGFFEIDTVHHCGLRGVRT